MINTILLADIINIYQDVITETPTGEETTCPEIIHENIPALIGCWKVETERFSCAVDRELHKYICVEIKPWLLNCFENNLIIEVIENWCNNWKYRIENVKQNKTILNQHDGRHSEQEYTYEIVFVDEMSPTKTKQTQTYKIIVISDC